MKTPALVLSLFFAVVGCRRTNVADQVGVASEPPSSAADQNAGAWEDLIEEHVADMRCAKVFSFMGYSGGGAKKVDGSVAMDWLFALCAIRESRIHELHIRYHAASVEGKAYILWGLYALDAKQFPECKQDLLKQKNLPIHVVEGCSRSKLSCSDFIALLESESKDERLKELTPVYPTEKK